VCEECSGARLSPETLSIKVSDKSIAEITSMTVEKAFDFFKSLKFQGEREILAGRILKEITTRLSFMIDIGLCYLTLDRRSNTLSGGEMQRIQLATKNKCLIRFLNYKWIEPYESSRIKKIDVNHIYIPVKKEEL
jgi:excinuclease ABC subunit A